MSKSFCLILLVIYCNIFQFGHGLTLESSVSKPEISVVQPEVTDLDQLTKPLRDYSGSLLNCTSETNQFQGCLFKDCW